jgi:hypothetical protein
VDLAAATSQRLVMEDVALVDHEAARRQEESLTLPHARRVAPAEPILRPHAGDALANGGRLEGVLRRLRRDTTPLRPSPPGDRRSGDASRRQRSYLCHAQTVPCVVVHATRLPFDPGSTIRRLRCSPMSVLRGGALEPRASRGRGENGRLKPALIPKRHFRLDAPRVFLSQAGPRIDLWVFQAGHQSFHGCGLSAKRRRRPVGSPSAELRMRLVS